MSNTTNSLIDMKLGRYEIRELIGAGGMARVFKGYDNNLDRNVAIKVLHDHYSFDNTFKERFEREAKFIATLNHPNIVQVFDFDSIVRDGSQIYYMVMSYIEGQTLRDLLKDHRDRDSVIPQNTTRKIILDMISALGYAHQHGMVHRDVKPANILIDHTGKAVLTDFGIARLAEGSHLTQEGLTVGTPTYMSPEQATGEAIDGRSDLYALGIIFYELLAGMTPFTDDGTLSILIKHIQEDIPRLSEQTSINNPYLDQVIFKALAKSPHDRYQSAQEFADDVQQAFNGQTPDSARNFTQPIPVEKKLPLASKNLLDGDSTKVLPTSTTGIRTLVQKRHYSPIAILVIGLIVIGTLLVVGMLNDDDSSDTPTVESMAGSGAESMTGNMYFNTSFDDDYADYWETGESGMIERTFTDAGYEIRTEQANRAFATVFGVISNYDDHTITINAQLSEDSASSSGYGIIFRYQDEDNYNVFAIDGLGRYSIWTREAGQWRELRETNETWTSHPAINPIGEENIISVQIIGNEFVGMVNGEIVTTVSDNTLSNGNVGIYMATPPTGIAHSIISNYAVDEILENTVESMTGDIPDEN